MVRDGALIKIAYDKGCKQWYQLFAGNNRVPRHAVEINANTVLRLVEYNIVLSKAWFVIILVEIFACLIGGTMSDWRDVHSSRRIIEFVVVPDGQYANSTITIHIDSSGNIADIKTVDSYNIISVINEPLPRVVRRLKIYKISVISICVVILVAIIAAIVISNI